MNVFLILLYFTVIYLLTIIALIVLYSLLLAFYMFGIEIHQCFFYCIEIVLDSLINPCEFFASIYFCLCPQIETQNETQNNLEEETPRDIVLIINPSSDPELGIASI